MSLQQHFANSNSSKNPLSKFHAQHRNDKFVHFKLYEKDMSYEVKRFPVVKASLANSKGTKQCITRLTKRSIQRLNHKIRNSNHTFRAFVTLTYPSLFPTDGAIVKRQLNNFLTQLRKRYPNVQYAWVLEFQKRGAPHFHIVLSKEVPSQDVESKYWQKSWVKIVCDDEPCPDSSFMDVYNWREFQEPHNKNREKHLKYGCRIDPVLDKNPAKLANYFAKYLSKGSQKEAPKNFQNIGRWWGSSRKLTKPVFQGVYLLSEIKAALRTCYCLINAQRRKYNSEHLLQLRKVKENVGRGFCFWNIRCQFDSRLLKYFELMLSNRVLGLHSPPTLDEQGFCELIENFSSN